ncbi:MAG: methyltransferase domain-containing protein [Pseudomonadota bacterium]
MTPPRWSDDVIDRYAAEFGAADATTRSFVDGLVYGFYDAVLDIGCGTGAALRYAIDRFKGFQATGLDLPRMIHHARKASAEYDITYVEGTAEALPFPDASFRMVFALNSIHHWVDRQKGLQEVARVLKPSGVFALGGDVFDRTMLPEGQDYADEMTAVGIPMHHSMITDEGYLFTYGRKVA